jgi:hypothetical protein
MLLWVELRNAADTTTVAFTHTANVGSGVFANTGTNIFAESSGVLRDGNAPLGPYGQPPFVAAPGNYLLKMFVQTGGGCGGTPAFVAPALTYLLVANSQ